MKNTNYQRSSIFASSYGLYSRGSLFGKWFYFDEYETREEMINNIKGYLKGEDDDPEIMYQDFSNLPSSLYSEFEITEDLFNACKYLESNNDDEIIAAIDAYSELFDGFNVESFEDKYVGYFDGHYDLGVYFAEVGCFEIPEDIEPYFDYEKYGRDMSFDLSESNHYYFYM